MKIYTLKDDHEINHYSFCAFSHLCTSFIKKISDGATPQIKMEHAIAFHDLIKIMSDPSYRPSPKYHSLLAENFKGVLENRNNKLEPTIDFKHFLINSYEFDGLSLISKDAIKSTRELTP